MTLASDIKAERKRQIKKWGRQVHSLRVWFWILMEEVGEYYQAKLKELEAEGAVDYYHEHCDYGDNWEAYALANEER